MKEILDKMRVTLQQYPKEVSMFGILVLITLVVSIYSFNTYEVKSTEVKVAVPKVTVPEILDHKETDSKSSEEIYAVLVPRNAVKISSATAATIKKIMRPGDRFAKDDVIATFDSTVLELQKEQLREELSFKEAEFRNKENLYKLKSASKMEYLKAKYEYQKTKSQLAEVDHKISLCRVRAPYDGEIIEQKINEGELININDPILYIVNNKELDVKMHITFERLHQIKVGDSFSFVPEGSRGHPPFNGKITRIVPHVDPVSQLTLVYGQIEDSANDHTKIPGIWSGISGVVNFMEVPLL